MRDKWFETDEFLSNQINRNILNLKLISNNIEGAVDTCLLSMW